MSDGRRLYSVTVTCEIQMPVYADSAKEAEEIALENYREEPCWDDGVTAFAGEPLTSLPDDFHGALPWGGDGRETCDAIMRRLGGDR